MASTKDPADPSSWKRCDDAKFVVNGREQSWFRPSHAGAVWTDSAWADCRDPMVMKDGKTWYMFYSGSDIDGGITGVAVAPDVLGPWTDRGAVMKVGAGIPESCFVLKTPDKGFLMVFNHAGPAEVRGIKTAGARSLVPVKGVPPFGDIRKLDDGSGSGMPGWAHEFLSDGKEGLLAACLTGYWVNFRNAVFCKESFGWTIRPSGKGVSR